MPKHALHFQNIFEINLEIFSVEKNAQILLAIIRRGSRILWVIIV